MVRGNPGSRRSFRTRRDSSRTQFEPATTIMRSFLASPSFSGDWFPCLQRRRILQLPLAFGFASKPLTGMEPDLAELTLRRFCLRRPSINTLSWENIAALSVIAFILITGAAGSYRVSRSSGRWRVMVPRSDSFRGPLRIRLIARLITRSTRDFPELLHTAVPRRVRNNGSDAHFDNAWRPSVIFHACGSQAMYPLIEIQCFAMA